MLKFQWRSVAPNALAPAGASLLDRPDLQIRDLRDDPRLRRVMGLDEPLAPRFDRRRLLDQAAA